MSQIVNANQKYIRTSARKLRLVADLVRGLPVDEALTQLSVSTKRAASVIKKVLTQAQKNAINNSALESKSLTVDKIVINEGPTYKRWRPVSRGRAHPIMKRSSHIQISVRGQSTTPSNKEK